MSGEEFYSWTYYMDRKPDYGVLCEFKQMISNPEQSKPWVGYREELHPAMNCHALAWRLTGIAKESK